jgi:hypothetical protein
MNVVRRLNRWFFSPLCQRGAGGDSSSVTQSIGGEIRPNPPLQKGGMWSLGGET